MVESARGLEAIDDVHYSGTVSIKYDVREARHQSEYVRVMPSCSGGVFFGRVQCTFGACGRLW